MLAFIYAHHRKNESLAVAQQALQFAPHNAWVQHAYIHAMECLENYDNLKLIKQLESLQADWPKQKRFFEGHNWMHLCLLKMQQSCNLDELLQDYHNHIWGEAKEFLFEQNNAFIFLWMAELYGYSISNNYWLDLAKYAKQQVGNYFSPYFSITTILALAKAGDKGLDKAMQQYKIFASSFGKDSHEYKAWSLVGVPMLEGMLAYISDDFKLAASTLKPVMAENHLLGHSDEQRAVFPVTLSRCLQHL